MNTTPKTEDSYTAPLTIQYWADRVSELLYEARIKAGFRPEDVIAQLWAPRIHDLSDDDVQDCRYED